jgi:hypothetical protein
MQTRSRVLLSTLGVALLAITTYRLAFADDAAPRKADNITRFTDLPCLVVFDLGSDGVDRTVLVDASITDIGGKRFLGGIVTDKFPDFRVAIPGKPAYVALDRIAYIQILDDPQRQNGG